MDQKKQVTIIGGGIIGLCSAYFLSKKGYSVHIIEKGDGSDGCSFGNAGFISPSHFIPLAAPGIISQGLRWMLDSSSPFYIKPRANWQLIKWGVQFIKHATRTNIGNARGILLELSQLSLELHQEIATSHGLDFLPNGIFMLCKTEKMFKHELEVADMASELGVETIQMDRDQLNRLDPAMKVNALGGIYYPDDAFLEPRSFMQLMQKLLPEMGVSISYNDEVRDLDMTNDKVTGIATTSGSIKTDEVVIAAGSYSSAITRLLSTSILLEAGKGYSFDLVSPPCLPSIAYILTEARVAVTPFNDSIRFGGTMEVVGLNTDINLKRTTTIKKSIQEYFPDFTYNMLHQLKEWAGLRPITPDGLPYIGRLPHIDNVTLATGHAQMGFTMGPVTGKLVSEIVMNQTPSINLEKLRINRFD